MRQYEDHETRDVDVIDKNVFFKAFENEVEIYKLMRERFKIIGKRHIFEYYFELTEYEGKL